MTLGEQCRELEEIARSGSVPDAADRVGAIDDGFARVRDALLAERAARPARAGPTSS
jgi:hypothetical protein